MDFTDPVRCSLCGRTLVSEENTCLSCRDKPLYKFLDKAFPLFSYRLWNIELLCRWKMKDERSFSYFFAELIFKGLKQIYQEEGECAVVPVPPREGKIKKRGWDQIAEISGFLSNLHGVPILNVLERKSNVQQKKLDREKRLETIGKSYSLKKDVQILPEKLIVLDDIITTGATVESCAEELKNHGCKKVMAISLFIVDG